MSGRVTTILESIQTELESIHPGIVFGFGASAIPTSTATPRIVWVPRAGTFSPAEKSVKGHKQLLTRVPTIASYCWGADAEATENLIHSVVTTLHDAAWGSYALVDEDWPEDSLSTSGVLAIVKFSLRVPVLGRTYQMARVTTLAKDVSGSVPGDNNIDWGET